MIPTITLVASLVVAGAITHWETQAADREFNAIANNYRHILRDGLRKYEDKIVALRAFFDAADDGVSQKEFDRFANQLISDSGAVEGFSWIPRVGRDERAAFELGAVKGGLPGYRITSLSPDGKLVPSEERDEYFPVLYSTVPSRDAPIQGLDLGSDTMRRQVLERARDTNNFSSTPILELKTAPAGRYGFFVVLPVFKHGLPHETVEDRRRNLAGFVQGVFQLSPLVDSILHTAGAPERLDIYVFRGGANRNVLPIHIHSSRQRTTPAEPQSLAALEAGTHWSGELALDNVQLTIVAVPLSGQPIFARYRDALAILAIGLLLTGMSQLYLSRRRRTEAALAESEATLKAIFDAAADGIAIAETATKKLRMVNAAFAQMLGYSETEILNLRVPHLHPEEELPHVLQEFEAKPKAATELPMKRKDGTVFIAQLSISPVTLGGTLCLMAVFRNVTERRAAEEALKQANEKLHFAGRGAAAARAGMAIDHLTERLPAGLQFNGRGVSDHRRHREQPVSREKRRSCACHRPNA